MNVDQFDTEAFRTDKLELTSGNIADNNGNVVSGVFDIHSSDYVLNADLRTTAPTLLRLTTATVLLL